jgi:hypothetical protein
MRIMTLVLAGTLAIFIAGGQALAAKRISSSGVVNPDRQYYKGAETCGGSAACYRAPKKKTK